jgi:peptide-methionine (S)-S-oxide reductase
MRNYDNLFKPVDSSFFQEECRKDLIQDCRTGHTVLAGRPQKCLLQVRPTININSLWVDVYMHTKRNYQLSTISDTLMRQDAETTSLEGSDRVEQNLHNQLLAGDYEVATFGAGSFWRAEAIFRQVAGVLGTAVGYIGGTVEFPTYQQVSTGKTGHVEAVQVVFDPRIVSYEKLLELFWELHNPTAPKSDNENLSSQYRSMIFYHNEKQRKIAAKSKRHLQDSGHFKRDIVTEIAPATRFYRANEYYQQYFEKTDFGGKLIK